MTAPTGRVARPLVWSLAVVVLGLQRTGDGLFRVLDGYDRVADAAGRAAARAGRVLLRVLGPLGRLLRRLAAPLLRLLRREALSEDTGESKATPRNEPGSPPQPANDDASILRVPADPHSHDELQSKPEPAPTGELPEPVSAQFDQLLAADNWPGLARLAATGALLPLGLGPADLASPAALGRAFERLTTATARRVDSGERPHQSA